MVSLNALQALYIKTLNSLPHEDGLVKCAASWDDVSATLANAGQLSDSGICRTIHTIASNVEIAGAACLQLKGASRSGLRALEEELDLLGLDPPEEDVCSTQLSAEDPQLPASISDTQPLLRRWFYHHLTFPYPSPHLKTAFETLDPTLTNRRVESAMTNWRRRSGWSEVSDQFAGGCKYLMSIIMERVIAGHPYPLPGSTGGVRRREELLASVEKVARYGRGEDEDVRGWLTTLPVAPGASRFDLSHILQPDAEVQAIDDLASKNQAESERKGEVILKNGRRIQARSTGAVEQARQIAVDVRQKDEDKIRRLKKLFLWAEGFDALGGRKEGEEVEYETTSDDESDEEEGEWEEEEGGDMGKGKQREEARSATPPPLFAQGELRFDTPIRMLSPSDDVDEDHSGRGYKPAYVPYLPTPVSNAPTASSATYDSPAIVSPQIRLAAMAPNASAMDEYHSYDDFVNSMGELGVFEQTTDNPNDHIADSPHTPEALNTVKAAMKAWSQNRNVSGGSTLSNMTSMSSLSAISGDLTSVPLVSSMAAPLVPSQTLRLRQGKCNTSDTYSAVVLSPLDLIEQGIENDENEEAYGGIASPLAGKGAKRRVAVSMASAGAGDVGGEEACEEDDEEYEDIDMDAEARLSKKAKGKEAKVPVQHTKGKAKKPRGIKRPKRAAPSAPAAYTAPFAGPSAFVTTPSVFGQPQAALPSQVLDPYASGYTSHPPPPPHPYATHPHYAAYVHAYNQGAAEYAASAQYWASVVPHDRVYPGGPPIIGSDGRPVPTAPASVAPYPHVPVHGHPQYAPMPPPPPHMVQQGQMPLYPPPHAYPGYTAPQPQVYGSQIIQHPPPNIAPDQAQHHPTVYAQHTTPASMPIPHYPQPGHTSAPIQPMHQAQYSQPAHSYAQVTRLAALPTAFPLAPEPSTLPAPMPVSAMATQEQAWLQNPQPGSANHGLSVDSNLANAQFGAQEPVRSPAVQLLPLPEVRIHQTTHSKPARHLQRPHSAQGGRELEVQVEPYGHGHEGKGAGLHVPLMSPSMVRRHSEGDAVQEKIRRNREEGAVDMSQVEKGTRMVFGAGEGRQWEFAPHL